ncbi:MAG: flagellar filament capping protein FliD [Clostridia bacterium]|nr:flagellar filament capping protein FliD [Clostridia bacterium]
MSVNRVTGLTTGMDTDQLVQDLMEIEQARYDKIDIQKTYAEWQQEAYRTTINTIDTFYGKYFDVLNQDNYLMSVSSFSAFSATTLVAGESKNYVSVEGSANARSLTHTIQEVTQLATEDEWRSSVTSLAAVNSGKITTGAGGTIESLQSQGLKFELSIDGNTETIEIIDPELAAIATVDDLVAALNTEIENVFGSGYGDVVKKTTDGTNEYIQFDQPGATVGVYSSTDSTTLTELGITSGRTNTSYESNTLKQLFGITDADLDDFSINGVSVSGLSSSDTLDEFMEKVNDANTGAVLSFDSLENRFVIKSDGTGAVNNVDFSDSEDATTIFTALGFADVEGDGTTDDAYRVSGKNAIFILDGQTIVKSENSFQVEGVKYTLNEVYTGDDPIKVTIENNTDAIYDKIVSFVDDYNALITTLNAIVDEDKNDDYEPLTDTQKEALSDDQIEKWETEAKKGILRRESNISSMLDEMRRVMYDSVEGSSILLSQMGITTSSDYTENGKLIIDEDELKDALENRFEDVVTFFTQSSDNPYLQTGTASERYSENGLMQRLDDIISNQIRTSRDTLGNKGYLIEKAGIVGDTSATLNTLSKLISDYEDRMDVMLDILADKEERYYLQFSNMETALAKLQSQSSSLVSMLG